MNGLYVPAAIEALDIINNNNNHKFTNAFKYLFFILTIFLNIGVEHKIATAKIMISVVSK